MESQGQRCTRLIAALEDLAAQEQACVKAAEITAALEIQRLAAPLVSELTEIGPSLVAESDRVRIKRVVQIREASIVELGRAIEATRQQLQRLSEATVRAGQVAPVYGRATGPTRRKFSAVG